LDKINPTEKLNSIGNSIKSFGDGIKGTTSGAVDAVKDIVGR
jgi:hypothetical protein